jgi:NTE family protein
MRPDDIAKEQRALIFQGGGSLGAFEAAVFDELYYKRLIEISDEENPLIDIVAGTSIGAVNAAILVSYVIEHGTWSGAAEKLIKFWDYITTDSIADITPGFNKWWDYLHSLNPRLATGEEARRYYSAKQFSLYGAPNVFSPPIPIPDGK